MFSLRMGRAFLSAHKSPKSKRGITATLKDCEFYARCCSTAGHIPQQQTPGNLDDSPVRSKRTQMSSLALEAEELSRFLHELCNPTPQLRMSNNKSHKGRLSARNAAIGYLGSLEIPDGRKALVPEEVCQQFGEEVPKMSTEVLVELLREVCRKDVRISPDLIRIFSTALYDRPLDTYQIALAADSLSYFAEGNRGIDLPLFRRMKTEFIAHIKNGHWIHWLNFGKTVSAFGRILYQDHTFWREIVEWLESNLDKGVFEKGEPQKDLKLKMIKDCVWGMSIANVDLRLVSPVAQTMSEVIDRRHSNPRAWLTQVHSLAILGRLDSSQAESVLNKEYLAAISSQQREAELHTNSVYLDVLRIQNISNVARLEIADYKGPLQDVKQQNADPKKLFSLVTQTKLGPEEEQKAAFQLLKRFGLMLRLIVPLNSHSTPPEWHKTSGTLLEGRCFVDPQARQFVPLREVGRKSGLKEVAVMFLMSRHLSVLLDPAADEGPQRVNGISQMNIRLLKKGGLHPVVFTEQQFRTFGEGGDERAQVGFIRDRILSLSTDFHDNEWASSERG